MQINGSEIDNMTDDQLIYALDVIVSVLNVRYFLGDLNRDCKLRSRVAGIETENSNKEE